MLTHLNLSHGYEVGPIIFILQMCKWRLSYLPKVTQLARAKRKKILVMEL